MPTRSDRRTRTDVIAQEPSADITGRRPASDLRVGPDLGTTSDARDPRAAPGLSAALDLGADTYLRPGLGVAPGQATPPDAAGGDAAGPGGSAGRFASGAWPLAIRRFPTLTVATPRLHVRPVTPEDAGAVSEIFADRQTRRWLPIPREYGQIDGTAWCTEMAEERRGTGSGDHYAVVRREDDRLIGCLWTKRTDWVAWMTEISYAVCPELRGFGMAAEAVDGLAIALVLERGFQRIEMRVAPGNVASRRVAEKAGFSYEGLLRNAAHVYSGRVDLEVWSLVANDLR